MERWTLERAPANLNAEARKAWEAATEGPPGPGEIWLLSWNGVAEALVVVTSVYDGFFRGMPVTLGAEEASSTEAILPEHLLGVPGTVWFHAETGLGDFLLHRRVCRGIDTGLIQAWRASAYLDAAPAFATGAADRKTGSAERERVLRLFQRLCYLEWPTVRAGEADLDAESLRALGIDVGRFADLASLDTEAALEIWTGERPVPAEVFEKVASALDVEPSTLLRVGRDASVSYLRSPQLKDLIAELSRRTGRDERTVRNEARSSYALAARSQTVFGRELTALQELLNRQIEALRESDASND